MKESGKKILIQGTVQGVGFRPWVYRLAREEGIAGTVRNDSSGVTIEAFGTTRSLESFVERLESSPPPAAVIRALHSEPIPFSETADFTIVGSTEATERTVSIPPDLATCTDCLAEVDDPEDRRFRYPFTNCTNCGPRFTIVLDIPYDRPVTTMARFQMCTDCRREYENPEDRRFHAQPNACPSCGPRLTLWSQAGDELARDHAAIHASADALRCGRILALKGLGGFHLMVDARDPKAVARLRRRKARYEKPLAIMLADLDQVQDLCEVSPAAEDLLSSPQAPIVLLRRRPGTQIADEVAPGNPYLGVMTPYTPLHHLLLQAVRIPLVATSGNLSDEPICIDNEEAGERLGPIADLYLVHDRPIARHADDSVAWVVDEEPGLIRRARGYAPAPVTLASSTPTILAVGAHLKNTVAVNLGANVFISQHIGDMETPQAIEAFERVIDDLLRMCEAEPVALAHDLHPDYVSTQWALRATGGGGSSHPADGVLEGRLAGIRLIPVQHHHAHLASCLAENGIDDGSALGVTWDGTGYGTDGAVWGGEFLHGSASSFQRVARLRQFRLPGGDSAVKEPRRVALAVLHETLGESVWEQEDLAPIRSLDKAERTLFRRMLETGLGSPSTTSVGRLFDAVASIIDLRQQVSFEGQAAMTLEFVADTHEGGSYPLPVEPGPATVSDSVDPLPEEVPAETILELDWRPLVEAVLQDSRRGVEAGMIAARFHNSLVGAIVAVARAIGESRVALTGGCFQNRLLTERAARRLREAGFEVLLHRKVPPNDGGISLGQVAVAAARLSQESLATT
ncbi:MAG: carbamoyltransferase HypF [Thermoanaerobaculia bacterium]